MCVCACSCSCARAPNTQASSVQKERIFLSNISNIFCRQSSAAKNESTTSDEYFARALNTNAMNKSIEPNHETTKPNDLVPVANNLTHNNIINNQHHNNKDQNKENNATNFFNLENTKTKYLNIKKAQITTTKPNIAKLTDANILLLETSQQSQIQSNNPNTFSNNTQLTNNDIESTSFPSLNNNGDASNQLFNLLHNQHTTSNQHLQAASAEELTYTEDELEDDDDDLDDEDNFANSNVESIARRLHCRNSLQLSTLSSTTHNTNNTCDNSITATSVAANWARAKTRNLRQFLTLSMGSKTPLVAALATLAVVLCVLLSESSAATNNEPTLPELNRNRAALKANEANLETSITTDDDTDGSDKRFNEDPAQHLKLLKRRQVISHRKFGRPTDRSLTLDTPTDATMLEQSPRIGHARHFTHQDQSHYHRQSDQPKFIQTMFGDDKLANVAISSVALEDQQSHQYDPENYNNEQHLDPEREKTVFDSLLQTIDADTWKKLVSKLNTKYSVTQQTKNHNQEPLQQHHHVNHAHYREQMENKEQQQPSVIQKQIEDPTLTNDRDRPFDVPQIQCNKTERNFERFACPTPDARDNYVCIEDKDFCDGFYNCPNHEDEDRHWCMFYRMTVSHIDVLATTFLNFMQNTDPKRNFDQQHILAERLKLGAK